MQSTCTQFLNQLKFADTIKYLIFLKLMVVSISPYVRNTGIFVFYTLTKIFNYFAAESITPEETFPSLYAAANPLACTKQAFTSNSAAAP